MTIMDHIKAGFSIAHRNWMLILVHMGVMFLNGILFLFIVGMPIVIALVVMGFDPGELERLQQFLESAQDPIGMISSYIGLVLLILMCILVYITIALGISFYAFSATVGVLGKSIEDKTYRFSMGSFIEEGNRLFWRMAWYMSIVGLIALVVSAAFLVAVVVASLASEALGLSDSSLEIFFKVLFFMCLGTAGLLSFLALYSLSIQGLAPLTFDEISAYASFKRAYVFLENDLRGLGLLAGMVMGMLVIQSMIVGMGMALQAIPLIGFLISIPMQFVYKAIGTYVNMVLISVALGYYHTLTKPHTKTPELTEPLSEVFDDTSSPVADTSLSEASWQAPPPFRPGNRQSD
ncbi:hypothetical protein ACFLZI_03230 [Nitrospirota bacterium]